MKISVWPSQVPSNGVDLYKILTAYMSKTDQIIEASYDADAALIWSVLWNGRMSRNQNVWKHYRSKNKPVIVIEVGGLVRNVTWRLSINGITRSAIFPKVEKLDYNRPKMLNLSILPWHTGDYVLICGQHGKSEQWVNMLPMNEYFKQTVLDIRKHTNRPIVIRSHPRFRENVFFNIDKDFFNVHKVEWNIPKHIQKTYDSFDLENLLAHCHCVISHSSNSGINAVIAGTPAIVSKESLAYDVGATDISIIENLPTPNREQWFVELCHKEWLEHELEYAWLNLRKLL
jgi:hypothetical protein